MATTSVTVDSGKYNMFSNLKTPRDITSYMLFRGTTDWTQLEQFDLYKSGYPYLINVSYPRFMESMADVDGSVKTLIQSYLHVIEYEFLGFDSGLQNIETETSDISNGQQSINPIIKVSAPSGQTFSMTYKEKAGGTITKTHELYLRSISDPVTTFKTYNGLIGFDSDQLDPSKAGFDQECFSFLYLHTSDTGLELERSAYLTCCQPTTAQLDIYNGKRGEVQFQDISVEFNGIPIQGSSIDARAKQILNWMNSEANTNRVIRNSWNYEYAAIGDDARGLQQSSLIGNT
jgi:hypothetical protein